MLLYMDILHVSSIRRLLLSYNFLRCNLYIELYHLLIRNIVFGIHLNIGIDLLGLMLMIQEWRGVFRIHRLLIVVLSCYCDSPRAFARAADTILHF